MIKSCSLGLLCVAPFLVTLPLAAQQTPPSGDTYVSSATPKTNYGGGYNLIVASGTTSYVQCNLCEIPAGATITKTTLRLYVNAVKKSGAPSTFTSSIAARTKNSLTYNTPPPALPVICFLRIMARVRSQM
jgi:hypothetical protein